jgi:hypothetical protein
MIVSSFIIQANVITIVNYDRKTFIVQATGGSNWRWQSENGKKFIYFKSDNSSKAQKFCITSRSSYFLLRFDTKNISMQ